MRGGWLVLAIGCGPSDVGSVEAPVVSGNADSADTSVVAVIVSSTRGTQYDAVCSGTVVSPHVVLTAAHCLDEAVVGPIDHVSIFLGTDFADAAQTSNAASFVLAASTSFDPKFTPASLTGGHDIGLVVASAALAPTPIALNRSSLGSGDVGTLVHAVGFGQASGTDPTSAGPRRFVDAKIFGVDDEHIVLDDVICEGDSGGPSLLTKDGKVVVAGVHSFTTTTNCVGDGDDTRVDVYASSFIDPVIEQFDPGFLPSGCNASPGSPARGFDVWAVILTLAALARRTRK